MNKPFFYRLKNKYFIIFYYNTVMGEAKFTQNNPLTGNIFVLYTQLICLQSTVNHLEELQMMWLSYKVKISQNVEV